MGIAAAGGALLVLTPTQDLTDKARTALYVFGGAVLAAGAWSVISTFVFQSSNEHGFRMCREGKAPRADGATPRVSPQVSPYAAGLNLSARF